MAADIVDCEACGGDRVVGEPCPFCPRVCAAQRPESAGPLADDDYLGYVESQALCVLGGRIDHGERLWAQHDGRRCAALISAPGEGPERCPFCGFRRLRGDPRPCVDHDDDWQAGDGWPCTEPCDDVEDALGEGRAIEATRIEQQSAAIAALRAGSMQGGPGRRNGGAEPLECDDPCPFCPNACTGCRWCTPGAE